MSYIINKIKNMIDLNLIGYVIASKYRKLILEALLEHPMTVSEMVEKYGIKKSTLYASARDLRDYGLISKNKHVYTITKDGVAVINKLHEIRRH